MWRPEPWSPSLVGYSVRAPSPSLNGTAAGAPSARASARCVTGDDGTFLGTAGVSAQAEPQRARAALASAAHQRRTQVTRHHWRSCMLRGQIWAGVASAQSVSFYLLRRPAVLSRRPLLSSSRLPPQRGVVLQALVPNASSWAGAAVLWPNPAWLVAVTHLAVEGGETRSVGETPVCPADRHCGGTATRVRRGLGAICERQSNGFRLRAADRRPVLELGSDQAIVVCGLQGAEPLGGPPLPTWRSPTESRMLAAQARHEHTVRRRASSRPSRRSQPAAAFLRLLARSCSRGACSRTRTVSAR